MGDWTANLLFLGRQQIVLGVNHTTLLPVLLPLPPSKTLAVRFGQAVGEMLMAMGVDREKAVREMASMSECVLAPTSDRSVLGTMNDFARIMDAYLERGPMPYAALRLAEAPCGPIGMRRPMDVTRELFSAAHLRLVKG
jgi:hypothetical protein